MELCLRLGRDVQLQAAVGLLPPWDPAAHWWNGARQKSLPEISLLKVGTPQGPQCSFIATANTSTKQIKVTQVVSISTIRANTIYPAQSTPLPSDLSSD